MSANSSIFSGAHQGLCLSGVIVSAGDLFDLAAVRFEGPSDVVLIAAMERGSILQTFPARSAKNTFLAVEHREAWANESIDEEISGGIWRQRHKRHPFGSQAYGEPAGRTQGCLA
jgi:hypothetical protein